MARFLVDVVSELDLSSICKSNAEKDRRSQAACVPKMMVRLLLYGYANSVSSWRKIQRRTFVDVAFRSLAGDLHPDHATQAEFGNRHLRQYLVTPSSQIQFLSQLFAHLVKAARKILHFHCSLKLLLFLGWPSCWDA